MGRKFLRGSKGDLRRDLYSAGKQIQEMASVMAVLLEKLGGSFIVTAAELAEITPDTIIKVSPLEDNASYEVSIQKVNEEDDKSEPKSEQPITARDIGASAG